MKSGRGYGASVLLACCSALLLVLAACGGSGGNPPPRIVEFTAEPSSVFPGETVVLRWKVDQLDGGRLRLESVPQGDVEPASLGEVTAQSSTAVVVEETTTFRLIAAGSGGTISKETEVEVVEPPPDPPQISGFRSSEGGDGVILEWEVTGADSVRLEPPGKEVELSGSLTHDPCDTTEYTLIAANAGGTVEQSLTVELEEPECLLFLIGGQSNASGYGAEANGDFPVPGLTEEPEEGVMMLDPDRDWVLASEPTHEGGKHSFLVRFGKEVRATTGKRVFLVPAAYSGSPLSDWQPGARHFDHAVDLAEHAVESLGIPFSAIIWYQGESDTKTESRRDDFVEETDDVLDGLRDRIAGSPDVIFVQLSKRLWSQALDDPNNNIEGHNLAYQEVREWQRLMEAGAVDSRVGGADASNFDRPHYYMAVAHDLPMSDVKHLSARGQRILGERIADVYLACIADDCESPPGPRLERITVEPTISGSVVLVDLSEQVNSHSSYDGYFAVFVDGVERTDFSISLDTVDPSVIRLEFASALPSSARVEVRYMPPQDTPLFEQSLNVVKDPDGFPLPAFGMPVEPPPSGHIPGLRMPGD